MILRHRVADYRNDDVHRQFMPQETWRVLHPLHDAESRDGRHRPTGLAPGVLEFVHEHGATHPRDLTKQCGRQRALNGWGSWSAATTPAVSALSSRVVDTGRSLARASAGTAKSISAIRPR